MAAHVAERARAEVVPAAVVEGVVHCSAFPCLGAHLRDRVVVRPLVGEGPLLGRADPEVPVERAWHGRGERGVRGHALRPYGAARPGVRLDYVAEDAGGDDLASAAGGVARAGRRCHLSGHARLPRLFRHEIAFLDRARERLHAADVLLRAQGGKRHEGVRVVGRAAVDGIYLVALLREHLAEVAVAARLGKLLVGLLGVDVVHVAQRLHLETGLGEPLDLPVPHAAHAHAAERDAVARGRRAAEHMARHDGGCCRRREAELDETSALHEGGLHRHSLLFAPHGSTIGVRMQALPAAQICLAVRLVKFALARGGGL